MPGAWKSGPRPELWFCYHPYYKSPDPFGPVISAEFAIPYITAEASYAAKRDRTGWATAQKLVGEAIMSEPGTVLSAVIDPSAAGRDFAENVGARWYRNFLDIRVEDRPDGVIVATPNQLHVENGMEIIAAGIPVLIEKPIADDVDAAVALVAAGEKAGIPLLVGHHRRHNPMIQAVKQIVDGGRLGRIVTVHGTFWVAKPDDYFDIPWRREAGAGPVLVNLIHDVDLFRYFFGEVKAVHAAI